MASYLGVGAAGALEVDELPCDRVYIRKSTTRTTTATPAYSTTSMGKAYASYQRVRALASVLWAVAAQRGSFR